MISTNPADIVIEAILDYLYIYHETLAEDKFSGVHKIADSVYRIHHSSFIPRVFDQIDHNLINSLIAARFSSSMEWDSTTLWLTISLQ
jgi:hypothetical protein